MTAARLREAATRLRGLAMQATPGPWVPGDDAVLVDEDFPRAVAENMTQSDLEFVATMDPVVAGLLADWLDRAADAWPGSEQTIDELRVAFPMFALAEAVLA